MTIIELLEYATSIGVVIGPESKDQDLITAIVEGIVTDKPGVVNFTGF